MVEGCGRSGQAESFARKRGWRIQSIGSGTVALGVLQDGKPRFALALEEGQEVPAEFQVGDELLIENHPADPASIAMGMNYGYYEVKRVPTGKVLKIMHRVYEYMFK